MNHTPESYHSDLTEQTRISSIREKQGAVVETKDHAPRDFSDHLADRDMLRFASEINPILHDTAHALTELETSNSQHEEEILRTTMESVLKIKLNTVLYEVRNVSDTRLHQHFSDTLHSIFGEQEQALQRERDIFLSFKNSPDEQFADAFIWKCKYQLEEIRNLQKNMLKHIMSSPPKTTESLQKTYLYIYNTLWEQRSLFAHPRKWMREFESGIAEGDLNSADSILKNFPQA